VATHAINQRLHGLYAITDQNLIPGNEFAQRVEAALRGGARILQYRDKSSETQKRLSQARCCRRLCRQYDATFIMNDDIDLCLAVEADGIHLGRHDNAIMDARKQLGDDAIIGISCYNDIDRAIDAQQAGADYVAFGTMFSSVTKPNAVIAGPDIIPAAKQHVRLPVCTIGGIETGNAGTLIEKGADMIAVISSLFAADDIEKTAQRLAENFAPASTQHNKNNFAY
jgi:thiamine-phosphate pyrophosphorylase